MFCTEEVEEEKVEETKTENEVDESTTKPNENQLSLSMCVNTDDVQDDLDEDLKEIQKVKSRSFSIQLTFLVVHIIFTLHSFNHT